MKKYLGTASQAFAAIAAPGIALAAAVRCLMALFSGLNAANAFDALTAAIFAVIFGVYTFHHFHHFYCWASFGPFGVNVFCPGKKAWELRYADCEEIGIGYHAFRFFGAERRTHYLFVSLKPVDAVSLSRVGQWANTPSRIKVPYSEALYDHLISSIPRKKVSPLQRDHNKYFGTSPKKK